MPCAAHPPELFGLTCGGVVLGGELLAAAAVLRVDEEDRARRDARHQVAQRRRWRVPAEHRHGGGLDGHARERRPSPHAAHERLAHRALARALGHDRFEARVGGGGLDELLAANREAQPAEATFVHVGLPLQEVEAGAHVRDRPPPVGVGVALAVAVPAWVEQQHTVAVLDEHAGLVRRPLARERQHRCAVLRGHVPAAQREAVGGVHRDCPRRPAQVDGGDVGHRPGRALRGHDGHGDRQHDDVGAEDHRHDQQRAAEKPAAAAAPGRPEQPDPEADQHEPRRHQQDARHGVAAQAAEQALQGDRASHERHRAEDQRQGGPPPRAQAREHERGRSQEGERDEHRHEVVERPGPRPRSDKAVHHDVQREEGTGDGEDENGTPAGRELRPGVAGSHCTHHLRSVTAAVSAGPRHYHGAAVVTTAPPRSGAAARAAVWTTPPPVLMTPQAAFMVRRARSSDCTRRRCRATGRRSRRPPAHAAAGRGGPPRHQRAPQRRRSRPRRSTR